MNPTSKLDEVKGSVYMDLLKLAGVKCVGVNFAVNCSYWLSAA